VKRYERMGGHKQLDGSTMRLQKSELRTWSRVTWWESRISTAVSPWIYHPCIQEENCLGHSLGHLPTLDTATSVRGVLVFCLALQESQASVALGLPLLWGWRPRLGRITVNHMFTLGIEQREKFTPGLWRPHAQKMCTWYMHVT
jgi:hypothetical protein